MVMSLMTVRVRASRDKQMPKLPATLRKNRSDAPFILAVELNWPANDGVQQSQQPYEGEWEYHRAEPSSAVVGRS
jgi:hypothetical protein